MKNRLWQKIQLGIVGIALVATFTACGSMGGWFGGLFRGTKGEAFIHTVRWPNESLPIIAEWYTGDKENWKALAKANSNLEPDRIIIGGKIVIPQNLLKTHDLMPQKFVDKHYFIHTVRWPNEWLSIIANWYTGEVENWKALAKANPHIDPNRIFIGNKIVIPQDLLKTREPMPKKFVDDTAPPGPDKDRKEEPAGSDVRKAKKIELKPIPPR